MKFTKVSFVLPTQKIIKTRPSSSVSFIYGIIGVRTQVFSPLKTGKTKGREQEMVAFNLK